MGYSWEKSVIARDLRRKTIKLGGLCADGNGTMWIREQGHHKDYPGYDEAQITDEENSPDNAPTILGDLSKLFPKD